MLAPGLLGGGFVLSFKGTSWAPVQKRARRWCPQTAGICYFFKYKEVWANLMNFPRLNSPVLCMGTDPCRTSAGARREATSVCRPAEIYTYMYPFNTQQRQKKPSTSQPTKAKSCQKHRPPKPGRRCWGMRSGQVCGVRTEGLGVSWSWHCQYENWVAAVSFGQPAAMEYVSS